jgi:hypothetical protein
MDDPMIRSRLGRITGARPLGVPVPKRGPLFLSDELRAADTRTISAPLNFLKDLDASSLLPFCPVVGFACDNLSHACAT